MKLNIEPRLLRKAHVAVYLGVSRASFDRLINDNPSFPKPLRLSERTPAWDRVDVDAWIESRKEAVE